jgi:DNA-directed RNA polymerase subunit RPC12/RpoP
MSGIGESYTCENCGGTFTKAWSDEEAMAETRSLFPPQDITEPEDIGIVCDSCFHEIVAWARVNAPELLL